MRIFVFIIFLVTAKTSVSQKADSLMHPMHFSAKDFFHHNVFLDTLKIDTSVVFVHKNLPIDTIVSFQYLGVPGSVFRKTYDFYPKNLNIMHGIEKNLEYYNGNDFIYFTSRRFTNLKYIMGSGKEQQLEVLHTQNFSRNFNFLLEYKRLSSEGFIRRQDTRISDFNSSVWYQTNEKQYIALLSFHINNKEIEENGGILDTVSSLNNSDLNLIDINLANADNRSRISDLIFYQKVKINDQNSLAHKFSFTDSKFIYNDLNPQSNFYNTIYFDTTITDDLLKTDKLSNILQYSLIIKKFMLGISARHELYSVNQRSIDTVIYNTYTGVELFQSVDNFKLNLSGEFIVNGSYDGDFLVIPSVKYSIKNDYFIKVQFTKRMKEPEFIYELFESNHFLWVNEFEKSDYNDVIFEVESTKLRSAIVLRNLQIRNFTFFNEFIQPEQMHERINYISGELRNRISFGKFGFDTHFLYQLADNQRVLDLPEISSRNTLYFESFVFDNALLTRIGIDFHYMSEFKGNKYMPALRQFYLQNEITVAGFPKVDLFVNLKIKTARVFLKAENLIDGDNDQFHYTVPFYPMPGRVLKFGINWNFYD